VERSVTRERVSRVTRRRRRSTRATIDEMSERHPCLYHRARSLSLDPGCASRPDRELFNRDRVRSLIRSRSSPGGAQRNPGAGVPGCAAKAPLHPGYGL